MIDTTLGAMDGFPLVAHDGVYLGSSELSTNEDKYYKVDYLLLVFLLQSIDTLELCNIEGEKLSLPCWENTWHKTWSPGWTRYWCI